ncbi:zinc-binding alcohol dehydrogenase family protein [uncultured Tateyamaria sp.]|uniref:zinc-binding alcohol dehydrogenase family protein n=1 Tax=uncultured Tateyamaria sp. TaxID=455651 RepID=UPI00261DC32C|nr:zinc-binding alcohol dehydrogenase family protein [uncultured Tateyamaria sp.]
MQVLVITAVGQTGFRTVDTPRPGRAEVLLDVGFVGLCGSDLNTYRGANPLATLPRIPGHEIGGTILSRGPDVPPDFSPGKRAIVIPYTTCGTCSSCAMGRQNACRHNQTLGVQRDGGMSSRIAVPHNHLILNDTLSLSQLALVEPLSVGFHAVARGRIGPDDTVVVLGAGMIGIGAILGALAVGARVIVAEISASKHATLIDLGVDAVIDPSAEDLAARVDALTDGQGADVVIEAVGLPETFRAAIDLTCFGGRVVYVGYAKAEVSYNTAIFNLKELDIMGSRNATRTDFEAVVTYLEGHPSLASQLISRIFPWAEAEDAFPYWEANRQETFKVMIDCQGQDDV